MNARSLITLIVLNVVLFAALAVTMFTAPEAQAQFPLGSRYTMVAGEHPRLDSDVIYIVNLTTGRMVAFTYDSEDDQMTIVGGRDVATDLGTAGLRVR